MKFLFSPRLREPAPPPLRGELLSIERLEERARSLAGVLTLAPRSRRGGKGRT